MTNDTFVNPGDHCYKCARKFNCDMDPCEEVLTCAAFMGQEEECGK